MPYKKYRKRKRRKRRRYYKKRRRPRMSKINYLKLRHKTLMPDQLYVKLKFRNTYNFTSGVGNTVLRSFALNGIFQCELDTGGAGTQPLGFNEWSNFYARYQVLASKIKVNLLSGLSGTNTTKSQVTLYPSNSSLPLPHPDCREQPYARHRYLTGGQNNWMAGISQYITVRKLEARSTNSDNYTGAMTDLVGTNPTTLKFWHVVMESLDPLENIDSYLDVSINYYVKLYRAKSPLSS